MEIMQKIKQLIGKKEKRWSEDTIWGEYARF